MAFAIVAKPGLTLRGIQHSSTKMLTITVETPKLNPVWIAIP
jgi:hypothetical protein